MDPHTISGVPEKNIVGTLFEGLTRTDPATLEPRPGVAERWDVSADALTYTFHLRADAKWSDGKTVTAQDFLVSFKRVLSPALAADSADEMYPVVNAEAYHKGTLKDFNQVGFRAIDERTFEMRLRHPAGFLLKSMATRIWYPVPVHAMEKIAPLTQRGSAWTRPGNLVGNGPFVLHAWEPNRFVEVRRSPTYWNRATVLLNGVRFIPLEGESAEEAAFRAGQLHITGSVPTTKLDVYRKNAPELLRIHPYSGVYYYSFNVTKPPFNDVRLRRALAMAVDRESIVKNIARAGETPAYHFTIEGIDGYVSHARTRLDFDAARKLLADAGYPRGQGLPRVDILSTHSATPRLIAEAIQEMWRRELGLDVQLVNQELKATLAARRAGDFQILRSNWIGDYLDPATFLEIFTSDSGNNYTRWSDPAYDSALFAAARTADPAARYALFQKAETLLLEAAPIIPIYYYTHVFLIQPSVKGWHPTLLDHHPYKYVWLEP